MRLLVISKSITQREYKSPDKYFNEINKIDLISAPGRNDARPPDSGGR
jgi:hypothetical protein